MRLALLLTTFVLSQVACVPSVAGAESLYRGRGPGIRVEFRVRGGEVYFARVRTVVKCDRGKKRFRRRFGKSIGGSSIRGTRIHIESETEEPGYSEEWVLEGGVHPAEITGRFWYQQSYGHRDQVCQTGAYQSSPGRGHFGRDSLRFWASRRPVHSRVGR